MIRRDFFKVIAAPFIALLGLRLTGCGRPDQALSATDDNEVLPETIKIWSYYVPLTSYEGIIEEFEGRSQLDRRIIFDQVTRRTNRISGRRDDGTENRVNIKVSDLQAAAEFVRVHFWHDDVDGSGQRGHTLHLFKRYLDILDAGEKVYVGTGTIDGHFHVVMIDPTAAGLRR